MRLLHRGASRMIVVALLVACDTSSPLVARTEEPMLSVVLTPDAPMLPDTALTALLATTATPTLVELRQADRFVVRRSSDGALFQWRAIVPSGRPVIGGSRLSPAGGNYVLPNNADATGLGRTNLTPGATYTLDVSTQGRVVTGSVILPERPAPVLVVGASGRVVAWPRSRGAAAYVLEADTERQPPGTTTDTFFVLRDDRELSTLPVRPRFRITAVDGNWLRFMSDTTVVQSGLTGAFGLFGAIISAAIDLPPRLGAMPASSRSVSVCAICNQ